MIHVVGTNYKQAPIAAREGLAYGAGREQFLAQARRAQAAREAVLLRTCNRLELYYLGPSHPDLARELLCHAAGAEVCLLPESVYHHTGAAAVRHLFSVASGLDSMVLGEHEILGQVKAAAMADREAGPILKRLFDHAVRTGKRARRETAISSGIFSVGQCAARTAQAVLGRLDHKHLLVFGAGRIAKVTAKHMATLGVAPVTVFSRTYARSLELAELFGGRAVVAEGLMEALQQCDIIVGCTSAPHHVITCDHIAEAVRHRAGRPLVVIDLGLPRNVDPAVGRLSGVHLFNLDDLEGVVATHLGEREQEVARVTALVEEEVADFLAWRDTTRVSPLIAELRARGEQARQECLALAERQVPAEDLPSVAYLMDLLVRKLLHQPIAAIRQASAVAEPGGEVLAAARDLFGLGGTPDPETEVVAPAPTGGRSDALFVVERRGETPASALR